MNDRGVNFSLKYFLLFIVLLVVMIITVKNII